VQSKDLNVLGVIADRLVDVFKEPIAVGNVRLDVRAAVGASFFPEHGEDGESLVRRASLVARDALRKDVTFELYKGASERENPERLALAADLRGAIEAGALQLHYQPKVRIRDGTVVGYEALVRWFHPSKGAIAPATFIPVAEQMGLIGSMTNNVIKMAVRQLHEWAHATTRMPVAVNLSARNLYDPQLITLVDRWLKSYDVPAELLHFEITESALVEEPEVARKTLNDLRARGSTIYVDDFGTGYSSLSYLATLPINSLKIDRSFIRQMGESRQAYAVVSSIILMAHNLQMSVVAEGVETAEQLAALKRLGCEEAQGYFFGKPVPAGLLDSRSNVPLPTAAKILVVDDDPITRELVALHLSNAGYTINSAEDGADAVLGVFHEQPDLIIVGVNMPYMDGFEFVAAVQKEATMRSVPVIFLTSDRAGEARAKELGAADHIPKPIGKERLLSVVARHLSAGRVRNA
jgi:EAL domain-containing protein (putative c-di-GMP-specific phosphodiesterase class I)/CheY-like chemotaxis protein